MEGLCAELHHHKFHPSHQLYKKSLRDIDIPPRKLLSRRSAVLSAIDNDMFLDSPRSLGAADSDTIFQKFLPYNSLDDDDDADPYSSDHFRMYEFKVRRCTRSRSHDWTDCPFAHPGEKARRRDPRRFHYSGTVCSEFRKGSCSRGDNCEFAHGVFECWLHPTRYRTEACKDGKNCKRKVCFFAHTPRQLRVLPPGCHDSGSSPRNNSPGSVDHKKYRPNLNHCCVFCHSASPTSTLIGMSHISPPMSPSLSPPLSPANRTQFSPPMSRYTDRFCSSVESSSGMGQQMDPAGLMTYKDALTELVSSLEAMNVNHEPVSSAATAQSANFDGNLPWLDVNFNNNHCYDDQQQFLLSPSTPSPSPISSSRTKFYTRDFPSPSPVSASRLSFVEEPNNNNNGTTNKYYSDNGLGGPDLGWVNDLLT